MAVGVVKLVDQFRRNEGCGLDENAAEETTTKKFEAAIGVVLRGLCWSRNSRTEGSRQTLSRGSGLSWLSSQTDSGAVGGSGKLEAQRG